MAPEADEAVRRLLAIAAIVVVLAGLHAAATVVVPVFVALLVTAIVAPYQRRLISRGMTRWLAFGLVLTITVLGILIIVGATESSLSAFIADLPQYEPGSERLLNDTLAFGKSVGVDLTHFVHSTASVRKAFSAADSLSRSLLASIAAWTVVLVLTIFMLFEALDFPEKLVAVFGSGPHVKRLRAFAGDLSRSMSVLTVGAGITAIGDLVALVALGVPSALLWAGLAFLFSYIPSVGWLMIVLPPTIATLVRFGFARALVVLALLTIIDNVAGLIVVPRLIGKRLDIAPFWGMLGLVFWAWLLGPAGAVLAIPLTMVAKYLLESSPATQKYAALIAPLASSARPAKAVG